VDVKPLIGCEILGFRSVAVEKFPFYCDVAPRHWVIDAPSFETTSWPHLRKRGATCQQNGDLSDGFNQL